MTHTQLKSDSLVQLLRTLAVLAESYDTHTQLVSDSLVSLLKTLAVPAESYDTHTHNLEVTRSSNY